MEHLWSMYGVSTLEEGEMVSNMLSIFVCEEKLFYMPCKVNVSLHDMKLYRTYGALGGYA